MKININVTVYGGARTPIDVRAHSTAVNRRVMQFRNGTEISDVQIAEWIQEQLATALRRLSGE